MILLKLYSDDSELTRRAGRPKLTIPKDQLEHLIKLKIPIATIAKQFDVCRGIIYKAIQEYGINYNKFSEASLPEVEEAVATIKQMHPDAGEVMVMGHLASKGMHFQRNKVRKAIHTVDPDGVRERSHRPIKRRVYSVPCPNYLWHIVGNHKLVRWRLVVHHGIDGYSRLVVFAHCSPNNRAETVLSLFTGAIPKYGRPLRIRTDHGGENVEIWKDMISARPEESKPVLVGKSVHNQRIERHNRALNEQVMARFRREFYQLESDGVLDVNNDTDILCLHYVYLPRINQALDDFVAAHNNHKISTERNRTPEQLFWCNLHLARYHEDVLPEHAHQPDIRELMASDLPHAVIPETPNTLNSSGLEEIDELLGTLEDIDGMLAYRQVVTLVGQHMLASSY